MTDYINNDGAAVDRWLAIHHQRFLDGLAARLDIEAGLEEVLLSERHEELVAVVSDKLDLEAGLAAILPPEPEPLPPAVEDSASEGSLEWVSSTLAEMPLQIRLTSRALYAHELNVIARHATVRAGSPSGIDDLFAIGSELRLLGAVLAREPRDGSKWLLYGPARTNQAAELSKLVSDAILHDVAARAADADETPEDPDDKKARFAAVFETSTPDGNPMEELWGKFKQTTDELHRRFLSVQNSIFIDACFSSDEIGAVKSPRRWVQGVAKFARAILKIDDLEPGDLDQPSEQVAARLFDVADHLMYVERMLNDFTNADLRNVNLAGMPLDGVRWSEAATQWPADWREEIERDSIPVGEGIFEIHNGTNTRGRDSLV
ncbi:hypothetical protein C5E51_23360 [Nocardia nova]|uniref:hypothetical protein n=1 Tax=Nocardia nova TaxID=37330 RepID=UPI000CEA18D5|nr:hypothetical protein [Nocardia nova]PPJ05433.1 hypothetical protein C5E51_23360 [Nocardia nova]